MIEKLGFDLKDVYAFGDGLNDIEMIQSVGNGIAMGNAVQEVKNHANYITKHVDDDGILHGLKHFELI
jgi:hydroxymethylpyrimidine pyrophosphatase-like HAD family hydrolase